MKSFLNNIDTKDFNEKYDHWIFDLDNTIYDFNLGLFTTCLFKNDRIY